MVEAKKFKAKGDTRRRGEAKSDVSVEIDVGSHNIGSRESLHIHLRVYFCWGALWLSISFLRKNL
jgi:hypothetical protein